MMIIITLHIAYISVIQCGITRLTERYLRHSLFMLHSFNTLNISQPSVLSFSKVTAK